MNTQSGDLAGGAVTPAPPNSTRLGRTLASLCLLMTAVGLFSGCARMKQYSLDSWNGPLPMHDLRYVQSDP
jgi:hypothetical protein